MTQATTAPKIRIRETFKEVWQFALANYGTALNKFWFLLLLLLGVQLSPLFLGESINPISGSTESIEGNHILLSLLYLIVVAILYTIIYTYFLRMAGANDFNPTGFLGLRFEKYEYRVTWAYLKMMLVMLPPIFVVATIAAIATASRAANISGLDGGDQGGTLTVILLVALFFLPFIWITIRLTPMIAAAALGDNYKLKTIWKLTKGHFWRILGASVLISLPYILGAILLGSVLALMGTAIFVISSPTELTAPPEMSMLGTVILHIFSFLIEVFGILLSNSGMAIIYKKLKA